MADVAGGALRAALQDAAGDDAGADAGRDLDEDEVVDVGPGELALAERHDVDVVVDEHRHVEGARWSQPGTSKRSQPGMIGGLIGRPVQCSTGPGSADADREQVVGLAPELVEQLAGRRSIDPAEHGLGPLGDVDALAASRPRMRPVRSLTAMRTWEAPTSTPSTTRPLAAIANCDDGRPPVETASPTGPTSPSCMSASMRRATVERARPGHRRELGARARPTVAQDLEQLARDRGAEGVDVPVARPRDLCRS